MSHCTNNSIHNSYKMSTLVQVLVVLSLYAFVVVDSTCTPAALDALDIYSCAYEIKNQYNWEVENASEYEYHDCSPWNIIFVRDTSDTVRRSIDYGEEVYMETIQDKYVRQFFEVFPQQVTNNTMGYISFATEPVEYIGLGEIPDHEEFLEKAVNWTNDPFYNDPFFTASHRGWTDMSNAMDAVSDMLQASSYQKTLIIFMSDGRPENRGSPELAETVVAMNALRERYSNITIHLHCFQMRFDDEEKLFWRNEEICDSKDLSTTLNGLQPHKFLKRFQFWADRQAFCNGTQINTTVVEKEVCADRTIFLPARFHEATASVNNLCGDTGEPIIRYTDNVFGTSRYTDIDVILECNKTLSPGYDIVNDLTPRGFGLGLVELTPGLSVTFTIKFVNTTTGLPYVPVGVGLRLFDIDRDDSGADESITLCDYDEQILTTAQLLSPLSDNINQNDNVPRVGCKTLVSTIQNVTDPHTIKFENAVDSTQQLNDVQKSVAAEFVFRGVEEITLTFSYGGTASASPTEEFFFSISLDTEICPKVEDPFV